MTPIRKFWPAALPLLSLTLPVSATGLCPLAGPNLLLDPDFAIEAENPNSTHWKRARHAGVNAYRIEIEKGELTIRKVEAQEWFYYGQSVEVSEYKGEKMAFTAELKLDLTPVPRSYSSAPGGGLDIAARSKSGDVIWSSWRNHEPRLGKTDWVTVQVVFKVPPRARKVELKFMHEGADGTMQVRNPSFHLVDESETPCAVTPDRSQAKDDAADPPLR